MNESKVTPVEAQAVPDQPVAWYAFKHNQGNGKVGWTFHSPQEYATAYRDTCLEIIPLFIRPTPAAADQPSNEPIECEECEGTGCDADLPNMTCPVCFGRGTLVAASPAAAATQPLNVQPWPPGSSMLQVAVAPHAAAGPYPTAMRPATAEEAAAIASRFGGAAAAAGVPTDLLKQAHAQIRHLIDDLTDAVDDNGLTLYVPRQNLAFSNCIAALIPLADRMLAVSPVAPVGAPTEERELFETWLRSVWTPGYACPKTAEGVYVHGEAQRFWQCWQARALLSAQGCELATDATKQREREHSVHLAATPIDQDFRMRPASSEAAPSAEGSHD